MLHPYQTQTILNLCPICPDIQYKILMMSIGANGTPSSNVVRRVCDSMIESRKKSYYKNYFTYKENTLTSYCIELSLFNYMKYIYEESYEGEGEGDFLEMDVNFLFDEFVYDFLIAYDVYRHCESSDPFLLEYKESAKTLVKRRLQKMIEEELTTE